MLRIALLILVLGAPGAAAQMPPIGIIDIYGLRTVPEQQVRAALGVAEGDSFPASKAAVESALMNIPGVWRARITGVCCEQGKSIMYVGIEEAGIVVPRFHPAPAGAMRLPADVIQAGAALEEAAKAAVLRGDNAEDRSRGYSLMHDSTARAIQARFVGFAARDAAVLRQVLRSSSDSSQRALAAQVMGYGSNRATIIRELTEAVRDPSSEVRNNAMRALGILAVYAREHPDIGVTVPLAPFIDMLNSPIWTDRNKSSVVVMEITQKRDPAVLAELRARALPALVEMARWKSEGHATAPLMILGRIAGMSDEAIIAAGSRGDRQSVIDAAMKSGGAVPKVPPGRPPTSV